MFTTNYEIAIEEIARKAGKNAYMSVGASNREPVVGQKLDCTKYLFVNGNIAVEPNAGTTVNSVTKIMDGLYLVGAMEATCVDDVGPYPYLVTTRVVDYSFKIGPAIPNYKCNVAIATKRPEVGKECDAMVIHFHRTYSAIQQMTPIKISSIEKVIPIGKNMVWVQTNGENHFSRDFFVAIGDE